MPDIPLNSRNSAAREDDCGRGEGRRDERGDRWDLSIGAHPSSPKPREGAFRHFDDSGQPPAWSKNLE